MNWIIWFFLWVAVAIIILYVHHKVKKFGKHEHKLYKDKKMWLSRDKGDGLLFLWGNKPKKTEGTYFGTKDVTGFCVDEFKQITGLELK